MLGDVRVGMLAREVGGRLRFLFDEQYAEMSNRPTLSPAYDLISSIPYSPRAPASERYGVALIGKPPGELGSRYR